MDFPDINSFHQIYDCVVIGAGVEGSSTAYRSAKLGYKTLLLEQVRSNQSELVSYQSIVLPHYKVKTQYLHFKFHYTTFFYLERFLKKLVSRQSMLFHN